MEENKNLTPEAEAAEETAAENTPAEETAAEQTGDNADEEHKNLGSGSFRLVIFPEQHFSGYDDDGHTENDFHSTGMDIFQKKSTGKTSCQNQDG